MAYTNKELAAQIAQKEADKINEMASNYNIILDSYIKIYVFLRYKQEELTKSYKKLKSKKKK